MGLPQRVADLTPAEYLKIERAASYRNEYFRGQMFAMAGGSARHSRIKTNVLGYLNSRLKGQPCSTYDSDLRVKCPTGLYTYPDASVLCGELEFDDEHKDTVLNPTLLVEVLSKSTEAYDRGKKFDHYRTIPSLREYVLVSQDEPMVQRFVRNDDDTWTLSAVSSLDQAATLSSIRIDLPLAEVYERVDFTPDDVST
ncbi:MAG: Uma2 family endonuclease [Schlesneria sp.]